MYVRGLVWLILILMIVDLGLAQEVVEISGSQQAQEAAEGDQGAEPIEVHVENTHRHMQYDIPDDGLLPKWCSSEGKTCPAATGDIGTFDFQHELECMHKCRELSCMSAQHSPGSCVLSTAACSPEELTDGTGKYYQRLAAGETAAPDCPGGTSPIGLDEEWPTNHYCKGVGVECPGPDLVKYWFRPTARQCLIECNVHPACMNAHYRDKICYVRVNRCTQEELVARPGGMDFYRLKKGEECPPDRPLYEEEKLPYTSKFCMAWGKTCKGYDVYRHPQNIHPFQKCLEKCAKIKTCGTVDFFNNKCSPKEHRCTDEELTPDPNVQNFMRLQEGEDCPGNRKPPSNEAPWSERFCLKRSWDCPGFDLEEEPMDVKDFIDCLRKCVEATDCEAVQFETGNKCYLKFHICEPNERMPKLGTDMYYRLHEGDECTEDSTPPECPQHSSYMPEHSTCPVTCDNQFPDICDMVYEPGCECDEGYALDGEDKCVPLAECGCREHDGTARTIGESWVSLDCEVVYSCDLDEADLPIINQEQHQCPELEQCDGQGKCQCVAGYLRKEGMEGCQPELECGPHSTYEASGVPASDTCAEPNEEAESTDPPKPVCRCNEGYILKEEGGECVPYRDCGCKQDDGTVIEADTVWLSGDCGQTLTCAERRDELPEVRHVPHSCPENSHCQPLDTMPRAACVCDDGWTMHVDGTCIPGIECELPTVFVGQKSSCPGTCRQPDLASTCTITSGAGCQCQENWLLDDDENCLPAETCPCYDENGIPKNVEDTWMTNDCSAYVTCTGNGAGKAPIQNSVPHQCQDNAECDLTSGFPQCVCAEGFTPADDGVTCVPVKPPCDETLNTKISTFVEDVMSIVGGGCGSCSDTCRHPEASKMCPAGSKLCKCYAENHLFDETLGKCIPANECGCYDANGEHRLAGLTWTNNECTKQLTCVVTGAGPPELQETLVSCANCDGFGNCLDTE